MQWDDYRDMIVKGLGLFQFDSEILYVLKSSAESNRRIFIGGNGGSAAIAIHYVCDLSKGANLDWENNPRRLKPICLSSNIGYMSAISNDTDYKEVFKQQLINLASPGDILIMISSSGNSPNVVEAVRWARDFGMVIIGISGFSGGKLRELSHYSAHIPVESYEVCEDIHSIFGHFLAVYLRESAKQGRENNKGSH